MPGNFVFREGALHCEGVPVQALVEEHDSPLYVYSRRSILDRVEELRTAFAAVDPLIAYSVKANSNVSILRLLATAGCGADIVSGGELHRALLAGVDADRIVFSGVGKSASELAAALEAGIRCFNVESEGELQGAGRRGPWPGSRGARVASDQPRHRVAHAARVHPDRSPGDEVRDPE